MGDAVVARPQAGENFGQNICPADHVYNALDLLFDRSCVPANNTTRSPYQSLSEQSQLNLSIEGLYPNFSLDWLNAWRQAEVPQVYWYSDPYAAFDAARQQHKLLILEFSTERCDHCQHLNNETLQDPSVMNLLSQAIVCRIDPLAADPQHIISTLVRALNITYAPVVTVLDPSRPQLTEVGRINGFQDAPTFFGRLNTIMHPEPPPRNDVNR
jgi:hypothetical protein